MGLFGFGKRKVSVNVMGSSVLSGGVDGRYDKQAKRNRKIAKQKQKNLVLVPHTTAELRGYIEETYGVTELERTDERYKQAYMSVKSQLVFRDAPELVKTPSLPKPNHPPVSDQDPDYVAYRKREDERWREAVMLPADEFKMHLHVYNINVMSGSLMLAWLEVCVETDHEYLGFKVTRLEEEEHYSIDKIREDIIRYFGASEADKKAKNERYLQLLSVQ